MRLLKSKIRLMLIVFVLCRLPAGAQVPSGVWADEPAMLVGLTISELIGRFGVPRSVHAARGVETWQDDVVFVYDHGDFYIYEYRVWQIGVRSLRGINVGDLSGLVGLVMGANAVPQGSSIFYPLHIAPWPLMLRWDIDSAGRVQSIFIYRSDL